MLEQMTLFAHDFTTCIFGLGIRCNQVVQKKKHCADYKGTVFN